MELSGSNWGIFHDFHGSDCQGIVLGWINLYPNPWSIWDVPWPSMACWTTSHGDVFSVEHWDRSMDYSRRNNIIYIYIYRYIYIYMYINIFIVCWMCIYIVHIWLRIKTVNLEIDRKCSRLAKLCWTQVYLSRDPFGATQNLLWRQGSCRSHHRIPYHDRLLLVCWRTCARLTGTSA